MRRCLHCHKAVGKSVRRGLCNKCYYNPQIRPDYPIQTRGGWYTSRKKKEWTTYDNSHLIEMFDDGKSDREIAKVLGRSEAAVRKRRQRLGKEFKVSPTRQGVNHKRRIAL